MRKANENEIQIRKGKGYQTLINGVLKSYMKAHLK
jgi:uncharacterized protein (DUF4415 family)